MTPSPEQTQPNLPIEDEQLPSKMEVMVKIKDYWTTASGEPELSEFADYVLQLIHHYATKRELEVRIDENQRWLELYRELSKRLSNARDPKIETPTRTEIAVKQVMHDLEVRLAELKAQKEQENKVMDYSKMTEILDRNKATREDLDKMWDIAKEDNRIVKNLSDDGKNWFDLPAHLVEDLIKRYKDKL